MVPEVKHRAFGGVVIDNDGRILLRRPTGDYDGYVWTFPKGRSEPGESPTEAAIREVKEETGYTAKVISKLPKLFTGGTTVTEFFLMSPVSTSSGFDKETSAIRWATLEQAEK